jgi:2-isopropylmalate synthase
MSSTMHSSDLIYDWNPPPSGTPKPIQICDETLRDGLQGGVRRTPILPEKLALLAYSDALGLAEAVVGFPAQEISYQDALSICQGAQQQSLKLSLGLLGRMVDTDVQAIHRIQQASGHPVVAWLFVGCSPIRRYVETRNIDELEQLTRSGIRLAKQLGLPVNYGTEDTARAEPEVVERLFRAAIEEGAETVTICDTVGHLTPPGTQRLVAHFRQFLDQQNLKARLDFHGHNDRGLGVANALAAVAAGIDRIHCTALGVGERSGNTPLDQFLVNLKMQGQWPKDLTPLSHYCQAVARICQMPVPENYPILGTNAFLTQAGVHASTILKAEMRGETDIAALVYSGVNPNLVGLDYGIQVGPHSGLSNVKFLLYRQGIESTEAMLDQILAKARAENRVLSTAEVCEMARSHEWIT